MDNFTRNLLTEWRKLKLPLAEKTFVVGVSGGADSVSLLLALEELRKRKKLNLRFVAAHFNHDLRGDDSEADEHFVKKLASDYDFELAVRKEKIGGTDNLEQTARRARYRFFFETAWNLHAEGVITAHTLNDQAETFLLNLIRGSGLRGLGAMKLITNLASGTASREKGGEIDNDGFDINLIRPLLSWAKRKDTESFCHLKKIEYRYDTMNEDLAFKRVRIRKILLPMLQEFNPNIVENLARTAFLLQEDFAVLEKLVKKSVPKVRENVESRSTKECLSLSEFKNLFPSIRRQILREWLKNQRGNLRKLENTHIEAIENLISSRKSGKKVELPNGETVSKEKGKLIFIKNKG